MYRGVFGNANLLKVSLVTTAAMLAICLLALVETTNTAEADDSLPQNGKIAFTHDQGRPVGYYIYTVNPDGSSLSRLTNGIPQFPIFPAWSPEGTKIAYSSSSFSEHDVLDHDVYVINPDGSGKTNQTNTRARDEYPQWPPDGTKIAFSSDRDSAIPVDGIESVVTLFSDIYTEDADGSDVVRVTKTPGVSEFLPDWQPLTPKSRSMTVHPPDTGGPSLLLVASALLFSGGLMFYAGVKRRM